MPLHDSLPGSLTEPAEIPDLRNYVMLASGILQAERYCRLPLQLSSELS